jgi:hypothetical protein
MTLRAAHGFEPIGEEYERVEPDIDPHSPGRYTDPGEPLAAEMLKQAEAWAEEADAAQAEESDEPNESDHLTAPSDEPDAPDRLTIEVPLQGFTPEKLTNLTRLVAAKAPLLKLALGAEELPFRWARRPSGFRGSKERMETRPATPGGGWGGLRPLGEPLLCTRRRIQKKRRPRPGYRRCQKTPSTHAPDVSILLSIGSDRG